MSPFIQPWITVWFMFITTFIVSIVMHEVGHLAFMRRYDREAAIKVSYKHRLSIATHALVPDDWPQSEEKKNAVAGITGGFTFLVVAALVSPILAALIPVYLVGCVHDWRTLFSKTKKNN